MRVSSAAFLLIRRRSRLFVRWDKASLEVREWLVRSLSSSLAPVRWAMDRCTSEVLRGFRGTHRFCLSAVGGMQRY